MSSAFTSSNGALIISDWVENDEGDKIQFVAPCSCEFKRIRVSPSAAISGTVWTLTRNGTTIGTTDLTAGLDEATTQEAGDLGSFARAQTYFIPGDVFEIDLDAASVDYHITLEFDRSG